MKIEQIKPYGSEGSKRMQVEKMFNNIAHSYDALNHTLSLGVDRVWRRNAIDHLKPFHPQRILDVATGTGDFALLAYERLQPRQIVGCDISEGMMEVGRKKVEKAGLCQHITFQHEDCARLSFDEGEFDAVISAFALRNFENIDACMAEMYRVLRLGGQLSVIDLCTPVGFPMRQLFYLYKKGIMPLIGRIISHDDLAYTYLPQSMDAVPQGEQMQAIITRAGFQKTSYKRLAFGMCILYTGEK